VLTTAVERPELSYAEPTQAEPRQRLAGKRTGMVVFSDYPADPRPRRAVEALLREGMHIDLICLADQVSPKRQKLEALEVFRIPIRHRRGGALAYAYEYFSFILISATIFAWRSIRRRYHLIYVHNMPDILVLSALVPKLLGAKVILDQHDPMPELMKTIFGMGEKSLGVRVMRTLEKWSIAFADLVITVSVTFQRLFSDRSCPVEKVGVVMNSPDDEIFSYRDAHSWPARRPDDPFVIMYHGSLVERNGLELAVDALERVQRALPSAQLVIYGRKTPYLEQVMEKVRGLGLDDRVHYFGAKTLEELVHEIARCDVGVIPNPRNTFTEINTPTRIFEYLSQGKPVIAPRTRGIEDYFGEDSLMFFEPGDAEDLAKRFDFAATHAEEAMAFAERGQQIYRTHTWRRQRESLVCLVADLIDRKGPAHRAA
jgi:glycosyltransferase involved in cell wall biosynthesis